MPTSPVSLILVYGLLTVAGCAGRSGVGDLSRRIDFGDLQAVYGPTDIEFDSHELSMDLNDDGHQERVVFLADRRRGLQLPMSPEELRAGKTVDGLAIFDGRRPDVAVFYQYADYGGFTVRWDVVDGQHLLVSDGGRDRIQYVWGWWVYPDAWPVPGWEARQREYDEPMQRWGAWKPRDKTCVLVGK
jgi:hypothetical protein